MSLAVTTFFLSLGFLLYTYLGYPVLVALYASVRSKFARKAPYYPRVTVVMSILNEEKTIRRKLENLLGQDYPPERMEIVVVSDGSTDGSAEIIRSFKEFGGRIRLLEHGARKGKAAALNLAIPKAKGEIIVLTDARQMFRIDAVRQLASNFSDYEVGAVSGAMFLDRVEDGVGKSFSSYWDLEKLVRRSESRIHSVIGITGAIGAIRKHLFRPIPDETILDDVYIPMRIALSGYRVVYDDEAVAYDDAAIEYDREMKRKVRTLTGNFQLLALMPELISIRGNRLFWQYFSHKIARLLAPVFLFLLFVSNLVISEGLFAWIFAGQVVFYGTAVGGYFMHERVKAHRLICLPLTFVILNCAVCLGFINFVRKRTDVWV